MRTCQKWLLAAAVSVFFICSSFTFAFPKDSLLPPVVLSSTVFSGPNLVYDDKWEGDATDPDTGIEYTVTFVIVGNYGDWRFLNTPTVNGTGVAQ
jgi:hypothetical protein